jgi:hypothetical protein
MKKSIKKINVLFVLTLISINQKLKSDEPLQPLFFPYTLSMTEAQKYNYRDLGDLLSLMPSVRTRQIGLTGQFLPYRFRGISENKMAVLIDGHFVSDAWFHQTDLNLIPVEMVEKIEIYPILNPFGKNGIGCVTNIVTKNMDTKKPYTKFVYRTGNKNFSDLDITFGQVISPKLRILSGVLLKSYGKTLPEGAYKSQKIRSKLIWQPISDWECQYQFLHNISEVDPLYSFPVSRDTFFISNPHHKLIRFDHMFQAKGHLLGINTYLQMDLNGSKHEYREQDWRPLYPYPAFTTNFTIGQNFNLLYFPLSWKLSSENNRIKTPENKRYNQSLYNGLLQMAVPLPENFFSIHQLHAHIASDNLFHTLSSHQLGWIPSAATSLWVAYSENLRNPSLGERYSYPFYPIFPVTNDELYMVSDSTEFTQNDLLKPEISRKAEIGIQWKWGHLIQATCRGFLTWTKDIIRPIQTNHNFQYRNQDKNFNHGIETQLLIDFGYNVSTRLSLTYLKATDQNNSNLYERPNFWGTISIGWKDSYFQNDLHVDLLCNSRFWTDSWGLWNTLSDDVSQMYLDPAFYLDFKISLTFLKLATFSYAIDNLLNTEKAVVAGHTLPGKTSRFGITWQLLD